MSVRGFTSSPIALGSDGVTEFAVGLIALISIALVVIAVRGRDEDRALRGAFLELQSAIAGHPSIGAALAHPVSLRTPIAGNVYRLDEGVRAVLSIEAVGARRRGVVYVDAFRTRERWLFASMTLFVNGEPAPLTITSRPERFKSRELT